ncbi:MAG: hypothetical protein Kow0091_00180 [Geminocystis sp.]|uniref:Uncharacterized protein n=2 Tax=Cyanobacterium TaxID=102234 RepID=K9Z7R1_CYAAP|nr:hypothetical protein Cyan10605_2545 [Cyanobacterium aponinum PCC 10605]
MTDDLNSMPEKTPPSTFNNSNTDDVQKKLILPHEKNLENAYREANNEIDNLWDALIADGLDDEMW